ncbi:hypothetical protein ACOMHN_038077 [Nucella lapillus]
MFHIRYAKSQSGAKGKTDGKQKSDSVRRRGKLVCAGRACNGSGDAANWCVRGVHVTGQETRQTGVCGACM